MGRPPRGVTRAAVLSSFRLTPTEQALFERLRSLRQKKTKSDLVREWLVLDALKLAPSSPELVAVQREHEFQLALFTEVDEADTARERARVVDLVRFWFPDRPYARDELIRDIEKGRTVNQVASNSSPQDVKREQRVSWRKGEAHLDRGGSCEGVRVTLCLKPIAKGWTSVGEEVALCQSCMVIKNGREEHGPKVTEGRRTTMRRK